MPKLSSCSLELLDSLNKWLDNKPNTTTLKLHIQEFIKSNTKTAGRGRKIINEDNTDNYIQFINNELTIIKSLLYSNQSSPPSFESLIELL